MVRGERRIEHDIEQSDVGRIGRPEHLEAIERRGQPAVSVAQAHLAGQPFGDQHLAAGKERQAPWRRHSVGERGDRIRLRRVVRRTSLLRKLRLVVWLFRGTRVDRPALDQRGRCRCCRGTLRRGLRVCDRRNEREHESADEIVCSRRHSPDYMTGADAGRLHGWPTPALVFQTSDRALDAQQTGL